MQGPSAKDELLSVVDTAGNRIGAARRSEVHGNPSLIHPVVHCLVTNRNGELLLQLRGKYKDVQPGRWDTSVGGHVGIEETIEQAAVREVSEELGLDVNPGDLEILYRYLMQNEIESEWVTSFRLVSEGPFRAEPVEIEELRFFSHQQISEELGRGAFTPNFEDEFRRYLNWLETAAGSANAPTASG